MRSCLHCGSETRNPKFCSQRCAASFNNRGVRRHGTAPRQCLQCAAIVIRGRNAFCSLGCHRLFENERHLRRWLATGVPGVHALAGTVRDYILMEQNGGCAICGREPVWNGATLVFVLDHIDGDGGNHARSNVRLLCPNCDSQLPTFKARNRGNGRHVRRERYRAGKSY